MLNDPDDTYQLLELHAVDDLIRTFSSGLHKLKSNVNFRLLLDDSTNSVLSNCIRSFRNDSKDVVDSSTTSFFLGFFTEFVTFDRRGVRFDRWNSTACWKNKKFWLDLRDWKFFLINFT